MNLYNYVLQPQKIVGPIFRRLSPLIKNDELFLRGLYRLYMGRKLDLNNPKLYQEKLQWLKLYDRREDYPAIVDKITAKGFAAKKIGKEYIIPTYATWQSVDDIDPNVLPQEFVIKTNNASASAGVSVCTDKSCFDWEKAKYGLQRSMRSNIYRDYREWPYKFIHPQILAEKYLHDKTEYNIGGLTDYKFTCFNGRADNVMVCTERESGNTKFYFFDREWKLMPLNKRGKATDPSFQLPKPERIDEMFQLAGILSEGIPFVRVDFYYINHQPYFGEMTLYPASGLDPNILPETEEYFGNMIKLPSK